MQILPQMNVDADMLVSAGPYVDEINRLNTFVAKLHGRIDELLEANTRYLKEKRSAEAETKSMQEALLAAARLAAKLSEELEKEMKKK